jgi:RNA-directed DNA polymerase
MATAARADKLDTTSVNGPHGDDLGCGLHCDTVPWSVVEDVVRRLRRRIFKASQVGDLKRVRSLQKLMLRSRSNTLHSVRRVTQHIISTTPTGACLSRMR